jgi:hypothetical protein
MSYKIEYEERTNYLYVHIAGPESYDEASRFWEELRKEADVRKHNRFLIVDEVTGVLEHDDVYWLSAKIATLFYGKIIAYVDPKEESYVANEYGEAVVYGKGVNVRLFRKKHDAIEWLNRVE